jgi:hypothetical protein
MAQSKVAKDKRGESGNRSNIDSLMRNGSGGPGKHAPLTGIQMGMENGGGESKHAGNARKSIGQLKKSN